MKQLPTLLLAGSLLAAPPAWAQQPTLVHYSLRLAELTLLADTAYGLQLLVQPRPTAAGAVPGGGAREAPALVWLRFHPDSVFDWLNRAAAALRVPASGGPVDAMQWSPNLRPLDGQGGMLLGRHRKKAVLQKDYGLAAADSAHGWEVEITGAQADSLLRLLLRLAGRSRIDSSADVVPDEDHVDSRAAPLERPKPRSRGISALVAARYVVGVDGRAEPGSFVALFASNPDYETEAAELVRGSRFEPARKAGRQVRQLVRQVIVWP